MYKRNAEFYLCYCKISWEFSVKSVGHSNYDGRPFLYF